MKEIKNYIYITSIFISIFLIFLLKSVPNGQLWNEYNVLYVSNNISDNVVSQTLKNNHINDYISLNNQFLPINLSENSIEVALYKIKSNNSENDYIKNRNLFFYDKNQKFRLYYIPVTNKEKIRKCISDFDKQHIAAGVDSSTIYPFILPLIIFALIIFLSFFATKKTIFISTSIFTLFFTICNPFYTVAISNCLLLLLLFVISNLWNRADFIKHILHTSFFIAIPAVCLIGAFSVSLKTGLLFICEIWGITSSLLLYESIENFVNSKKTFTPIYILPAKKIPLLAKKTKLILPVIFLSTCIILFTYIFTSINNISGHYSKINLPAESNSVNELPQLEDYYKWVWNIKISPYLNINKSNFSDNYVEFPVYIQNDSSLENDKKIFVYNQSFKDDVYNSIDDLQFNSVEKLLKSQGKTSNYGYIVSSSVKINLIGKISMGICLLILIFIYISSIIKEGTKR